MRSPFPPKTKTATLLHLPCQLIEVLEAEGKDLEGVRQEFVAKTLIGLAAWNTAWDRHLISWGMIVLQKPVGGHGKIARMCALCRALSLVLPVEEAHVLASLSQLDIIFKRESVFWCILCVFHKCFAEGPQVLDNALPYVFVVVTYFWIY